MKPWVCCRTAWCGVELSRSLIGESLLLMVGVRALRFRSSRIILNTFRTPVEFVPIFVYLRSFTNALYEV